MFLILKKNGHDILKVVVEAKSRIQVIKWYEDNGDDEVLIIKADKIKDFIKKSE